MLYFILGVVALLAMISLVMSIFSLKLLISLYRAIQAQTIIQASMGMSHLQLIESLADNGYVNRDDFLTPPPQEPLDG